MSGPLSSGVSAGRGVVMKVKIGVTVVCMMIVSASLFAGFTGTDVFLPSVGAQAGVPPSVWHTTVWVHNPNTAAANVTFYLLERDKANLGPLTYTDTIPAGDTKMYEDAVLLMFSKQAFGALRVTSNEKVIVSSRIYSQSGDVLEDSVGQFFAGVRRRSPSGRGSPPRSSARGRPSRWRARPSASTTGSSR